MATRPLGLSAPRSPIPGALSEEDYRTFCAALESTQRGRDFLIEYGRRNRNADTEMLLDSLDRIETMMRADGAARDRLRDELRVLLIAIRLARPDIDSATALTKAARLLDLLDLMERRIDAMVENKDLPPIEEEPIAPMMPAMLSVVPHPDEPELPIPSFAAAAARPIALVQDVTLAQLAEPAAADRPQPPEPVIQHAFAKPETALQQIIQTEIEKQQRAAEEAAQQEATNEALQRVLADEPHEVSETNETPAPAEKWLPDFGGDENQIIHTKPVRSMAFMPEVTFSDATALPAPPVTDGGSRAALAKREPIAEQSLLASDPSPASPATFARHALPQGEREDRGASVVASPPPAAAAKLRDHPLAAIMSLSEEERIALFT